MWWPAIGSGILKVRKSFIDGAVNNIQKHVLQHVVFSNRHRNIEAGLWIWIRIVSGYNDFVDPDPHWESGSKGKKMKKNKYRYFFS
jgi:hypothetical protein